MITTAFTYQTMTPESAEYGDFEDHGYYGYGGWRFSMLNDETEADIAANPHEYNRPWALGDLRNVLHSAAALGIYDPSCHPICADGGHSCWWSSVDPDHDYSASADTYYSLHIDGVTRATRRRLHRVLNGLPVFG